MTIQECYKLFGGDYEGTFSRIGSEAFIKRLALKFLDDKNLETLKAAAASNDCETAFRAVHTLKGLALNLGFTGLADVSSRLTEVYRAGNAQGDPQLLEEIINESKKVSDAIRQLE